jgi:hypothetical protein
MLLKNIGKNAATQSNHNNNHQIEIVDKRLPHSTLPFVIVDEVPEII